MVPVQLPVPQATVDKTMNNSIDYILRVTSVIMVAFAVVVALFFYIYRRRSMRYAREMRERERLFDLLVTNTDTAFLLVSDKRSDAAL